MNKKMIALAVSSALMGLTATAQAVEVAGDTLNVYGKMHVSVLNADDGTNEAVSVSSNSSRIGFKGAHDAGDGVSVVWQVETGVEVDDGTGTWASRNSYAGIEADFGRVIFGRVDTPFKTTLTKWAAFRDTVGDARALFGSTADDNGGTGSRGNKLDTRGENSLMYSNTFGAVDVAVMFSADTVGTSGSAIDANANDMRSISVTYKEGPIWATLSQETQSTMDTDGLRIAAKYDVTDALNVGLMFESVSSDTTAYMERDIVGINARYQHNDKCSYRVQLIQADDDASGSNTGATAAMIGMFHKYDKQTEVYAVYTAVDNDSAAAYQGIDGGHGDELKVGLGAGPSALALGMIYKF